MLRVDCQVIRFQLGSVPQLGSEPQYICVVPTLCLWEPESCVTRFHVFERHNLTWIITCGAVWFSSPPFPSFCHLLSLTQLLLREFVNLLCLDSFVEAKLFLNF